MSSFQFSTELLNIKDELIEKVITTKDPDGGIVFHVRLKPTAINCHYCHKPVKVHGYSKRRLNHSTLVNRKCTIIYEQRRYICRDCNYTFSEKNPFIDSSEGVTFETKINVLKDLKALHETYTSVAIRHNLSKATVLKIFDKHVNIAKKPLPRVLAMDEHYLPESDYDSLYCCLLMNFETGELVDVLPSRSKEFLSNYFSTIRNTTLNYLTHNNELNNVQYISIDMYENFRSIAQTYFPKAKICADSFHVTNHLTKAFDGVRLRCRKNTEDELLKYLLMKFKHIFKYNFNLDNEPKYNRRLRMYANYRTIRDIVFQHFPELEIAYNVKNLYIQFNRESDYETAAEKLDYITEVIGNCGITEYMNFYKLLKNWRTEIINSFIKIDGKRINNSFIESKNRQLDTLIRNANGFVNFKRTRNRILYCLNSNERYTL